MQDRNRLTLTLARIEKLPREWQHPDVVVPWQLDPDHYDTIALDLHLRTIAERLAERGHYVRPPAPGVKWMVCERSVLHCCLVSVEEEFPTYAEALISAAEEVCRGG